jgi:iodotyrosine deiodinase
MSAARIPYQLPHRDTNWQLERGRALLDEMTGRRTCREFAPTPVSKDVIELALAIGHSAPSGANRKPWRFVAIDDPAIKKEIRAVAEEEEEESYAHRMPAEWLAALEPLGTDAHKPFIEIAPWLVVVFRIDWELLNGERQQNYYPAISATLAAGFFLMACHQLGLATLTYTPPRMQFVNDICRRPTNEKPFLVIPVGYPAADATVPDVPKKPLAEAVQWNRP